MAKKLYLKKGNLNYKERKYISALEKALDGKEEFDSATNFSELESLYNKYCVTDVEFTEINSDKAVEKGGNAEKSVEQQHKDFRDGVSNSTEKTSGADDGEFTDPFNEGEVIVRDYVKDGGMKDPNENVQETKTTFEEPTTFGQSFEMPNHDDGKGTEKKGSGMGSGMGSGKSKEKEKEKKTEPINPQFDEMSNAKKRKSTKKMAKAIVEGVCKLAEFGCVWWVTKDITEEKLLDYEINDTIDLQILLTLEDNQQVTVRRWFASQVKNANELLKIEQQDKDDLADSLYEVMLEKGIAPTPMQELIINAVSTIIIGLGTRAFAMQQQTQGVLNQLIQMRIEQKEEYKRGQQQEAVNTTHTETETTATTNNEDVSDDTDFVETEVVGEEKVSTDLTITN